MTKEVLVKVAKGILAFVILSIWVVLGIILYTIAQEPQLCVTDWECENDPQYQKNKGE